MGLKRFFELANTKWPVEEGKPRHAICFDPKDGLIVTIWLREREAWQWFYLTEDEFNDPENLIMGMDKLMRENGVYAR